MKIEQQEVGTVNVFSASGPLVEQDAEDFSKVVLERAKSPNPRLVVSMQDVPYLDSAAIEGLLDAADELEERGLTLKLARVPTTCREIFELTGVSLRFSFFEDVHDAVRSFM